MREISVYFDGSCEPVNPNGHAHAGAVVYHYGFRKDLSKCVGTGKGMTNNVAEYSALLMALEYLIEKRLYDKKIEVYGDSIMVINQMSGVWKIREKEKPYKKYALQCKGLLKFFTHISFSWIPREQNDEADSLSKCGSDLTKEYRAICG